MNIPTLDRHTKAAIQHTLHCLAGCSIGEVLGMVVSTLLNWSNAASILVSIVLAFFFGYLLTSWSLYRNGLSFGKAVRAAVATDTTSIISMEAVDNLFILLVPGALNATLDTSLFWLSLAASLVVAFIITVPVNRWFIARNPHAHHHH
ncbi:MAG: DUF4396 domain-containing protein [Bacillota bacterium]